MQTLACSIDEVDDGQCVRSPERQAIGTFSQSEGKSLSTNSSSRPAHLFLPSGLRCFGSFENELLD